MPQTSQQPVRDYWVTVRGYGHESVAKIKASSLQEARRKAAARYGISIKVKGEA